MLLDPRSTASYHSGKMAARTKLTTKGQIVIPKGIRNQLRWRPGTHLSVALLPDGGIKLDAVSGDGDALASSNAIDRAFGFLRTGNPLKDLEREHRKEVKADERWRRRR